MDHEHFAQLNLRYTVYLQLQLQSILNAAAPLGFRIRRYDHVTDTPAILHWLRLPQRVEFKVAVMAFRVGYYTV